MKKLFILFIAVVGFGVSSFAQGISTTASAKIVASISVTKDVDLNFGVITPALAASHVTQDADATLKAYSADGARTSGASSAAKFTVTTPLSTYSIDFPSTVTLSGTTDNPMIATLSLSSNAAKTGNAVTVTNFYIGGTLAVGAIAAQSAGDAQGSFYVTVAYE